MIFRNKENYSMFDVIAPAENYPVGKYAIKSKFVELCKTILYSDEPMRIARAYNTIFREYRQYIIMGAPEISLSIFEEVIEKLINSSTINDIDDTLPTYEVYSPFRMFLGIVVEQAGIKMKIGNKSNLRYTTERLYLSRDDNKFPFVNLQKYLYMYSLEHMTDEKNEYLYKALNKTVSSLVVSMSSNTL